MTISPAIVPGLLLLAAELTVLAAVGYVVVRVVLRQADDRVALAQGLVVGLALWGLIVNFVMYAVPGLAGAIVGWGIVLALGAGLAWRSPHSIRPRPRVVAGFAVAVLALLWVALASRQLLSIPDTHTQLGLAASIRAGLFPPELPWNPGRSGTYHHGVPLLVGLLTPPIGPDLAFMTEILGAYAWMSFTLAIATLVLQRTSSLAMVVTAPLLLTAGTWTFTWVGGLLSAPVPAGLPEAGLRASLTDIYWQSVDMPWEIFVWEFRETALGNIWKPGFPLAYALLVLVLERAARASDRSWKAALTLGGLVGFVGLLNTTLAPVALALWAGLEAVHFGRAWRTTALAGSDVLRSGAGLALAVVLLVVGGGRLTGLLGGAESSGLAIGWNEHREGQLLLGAIDMRPGGVGLLGMGPVVVAAIAALLGRRDRLVLTLVVGAGGLAVAFLVLHYPPTPYDLSRLAGHARNLALVALLLALSVQLARLQPRPWRYAASALLLALVVWPTVVGPVRNLGQAIGQGVELTNADRVPREWMQGRYSLGGRLPSARIEAYIRGHTPVDAHVLTPEAPYLAVILATGRSSAAGFDGHIHLRNWPGPTYLDALRYIEPAAFRRLGISYVHATDAWAAALPERGARRLADPAFFELLTRDGDEAIYGVLPAFLALDPAPAPGSFEALRRAVPVSATVYLPPQLQSLELLRAAWALSHARLSGVTHPPALHLLTPWPAEPLGDQAPDLVVLPLSVEPSMFPSSGRQPIWWNADVAVYAPNGAVEPIRPPPAAAPAPAPPAVNVRVSDVAARDRRLTFTVTMDDQAPDQWTGQDWQLVAGEASSWAIPTELEPDGRTPVVAQWFAGQTAPGRGTTTRHYVFDARTSRLALREDGQETVIATAGDGVGEGIWMLTLRLLREEERGTYVAQEEVAVIPLLQIEISETGEVSGFVYDNASGEIGASGAAVYRKIS